MRKLQNQGFLLFSIVLLQIVLQSFQIRTSKMSSKINKIKKELKERFVLNPQKEMRPTISSKDWE